jgi:hypothetical protein
VIRPALIAAATLAIGVAGGPVTAAAEAPKPSHAFSFGNAKLNKKAGTALLPVSVASPGLVTLAASPDVRGAGVYTPVKARVLLKVRPRGAAKRRLADRGTVGVRLTVTYAPDGGNAKTQSLVVTLRREG